MASQFINLRVIDITSNTICARPYGRALFCVVGEGDRETKRPKRPKETKRPERPERPQRPQSPRDRETTETTRPKRPRDHRDRRGRRGHRDHETERPQRPRGQETQKTKVRLGIIVCPRLRFGLYGPKVPMVKKIETKRPRDQSEVGCQRLSVTSFWSLWPQGPYGP